MNSHNLYIKTFVCKDFLPTSAFMLDQYWIELREIFQLLVIDTFESWCGRRLLRVPCTNNEIKPVNSKGNQLWVFMGRTDAEAEAPIFWPPDANSQLIGKDLDTGKGWRQEEKWTTEDEMVGWHHRLHGQWFEQALGDSKGQGSLVRCSSWGHKESDTA